MEAIRIERGQAVDDVVIGAVWASGCRADGVPEARSDLDRSVAEAVARVAAEEEREEVRTAVRAMLRHGKYKPTGRGKPASEYLVAAAREERFPRINALVDINNLVSLESRLPISVVDLERTGTRQFVLRRGRPAESYVFNSAGQAIELADLLLLATMPEDRPCANAVKDSMATKVGQQTREVAAFVYAPAAMAAAARAAAERFADGLRRWAGAQEAHADLFTAEAR